MILITIDHRSSPVSVMNVLSTFEIVLLEKTRILSFLACLHYIRQIVRKEKKKKFRIIRNSTANSKAQRNDRWKRVLMEKSSMYGRRWPSEPERVLEKYTVDLSR